jgi:hypothetical protein
MPYERRTVRMCDEWTMGFMMEKKYWVMVELRYPSFRSDLCELYEKAWKFKDISWY